LAGIENYGLRRQTIQSLFALQEKKTPGMEHVNLSRFILTNGLLSAICGQNPVANVLELVSRA
jgi:hypothetical protein